MPRHLQEIGDDGGPIVDRQSRRVVTMNDPGDGRGEGLVRAIGPLALTLNIINMVVGGGIFVFCPA